MWILPSALPWMRTKPEAVESSRRSGLATSNVRSKEPCSVGPRPQAAREAAAARRVERKSVRAFIGPPAKGYAVWAVMNRYGNWEVNVPGEGGDGTAGEPEIELIFAPGRNGPLQKAGPT